MLPEIYRIIGNYAIVPYEIMKALHKNREKLNDCFKEFVNGVAETNEYTEYCIITGERNDLKFKLQATRDFNYVTGPKEYHNHFIVTFNNNKTYYVEPEDSCGITYKGLKINFQYFEKEAINLTVLDFDKTTVNLCSPSWEPIVCFKKLVNGEFKN